MFTLIRPNITALPLVAFLAASLSICDFGARAWAGNPWASSVGEAYAVQRKTEDVAERLNKEFPYCQATSVAMAMDQSAGQLVASIKHGGSWPEVQSALSRTVQLSNQVESMIHMDWHVRRDRRATDYMTELSRRLSRLATSLDKDYSRLRPTTVIHSHRPVYPAVPAPTPSINIGVGRFQLQIGPSPVVVPPPVAPSVPWGARTPWTYPRDTYEFNSPEYDPLMNPSRVQPGVPLQSPIETEGPVEVIPAPVPAPVEYRI